MIRNIFFYINERNVLDKGIPREKTSNLQLGFGHYGNASTSNLNQLSEYHYMSPKNSGSGHHEKGFGSFSENNNTVNMRSVGGPGYDPQELGRRKETGKTPIFGGTSGIQEKSGDVLHTEMGFDNENARPPKLGMAGKGNYGAAKSPLKWTPQENGSSERRQSFPVGQNPPNFSGQTTPKGGSFPPNIYSHQYLFCVTKNLRSPHPEYEQFQDSTMHAIPVPTQHRPSTNSTGMTSDYASPIAPSPLKGTQNFSSTNPLMANLHDNRVDRDRSHTSNSHQNARNSNYRSRSPISQTYANIHLNPTNFQSHPAPPKPRTPTNPTQKPTILNFTNPNLIPSGVEYGNINLAPSKSTTNKQNRIFSPSNRPSQKMADTKEPQRSNL